MLITLKTHTSAHQKIATGIGIQLALVFDEEWEKTKQMGSKGADIQEVYTLIEELPHNTCHRKRK